MVFTLVRGSCGWALFGQRGLIGGRDRPLAGVRPEPVVDLEVWMRRKGGASVQLSMKQIRFNYVYVIIIFYALIRAIKLLNKPLSTVLLELEPPTSTHIFVFPFLPLMSRTPGLLFCSPCRTLTRNSKTKQHIYRLLLLKKLNNPTESNILASEIDSSYNQKYQDP